MSLIPFTEQTAVAGFLKQGTFLLEAVLKGIKYFKKIIQLLMILYTYFLKGFDT